MGVYRGHWRLELITGLVYPANKWNSFLPTTNWDTFITLLFPVTLTHTHTHTHVHTQSQGQCRGKKISYFSQSDIFTLFHARATSDTASAVVNTFERHSLLIACWENTHLSAVVFCTSLSLSRSVCCCQKVQQECDIALGQFCSNPTAS